MENFNLLGKYATTFLYVDIVQLLSSQFAYDIFTVSRNVKNFAQ